jgi:hypothetical protein
MTVSNRIRRILPNGNIESVYFDRSRWVSGLSVAADGFVYFVEGPQGVFRLKSDGSTERIAGGGGSRLPGGPVLEFDFSSARDVLAAANGDILIADRDRVLTVGQDGII